MISSSFPLSLPATPFVEANFEFLRRQSAGVLGSGRDFVIDRGQPYVKATLKTRPLLESEIGQWRAFAAALRGGSRYFTLYDPAREYPAAYMPAGWGALTRATIGGAFDGHCSLGLIFDSGIGAPGRDFLQLGAPWALPVGLTIGVGDYVELRQGVNQQPPLGGSWTTSNCTASFNSATDPNGAGTAATITQSGAAALVFFATAPFAGAGRTSRFSIWLKKGTDTGAFALAMSDGGGGNGVTAPISLTTTWQRYEMTAPLPGGAPSGVVGYLAQQSGGGAGQTVFAWNPRVTAVDQEAISLHRVLTPTAQIADAAGNLDLWVEPEAPTSFTTDALVNLHRPLGKFRMLQFELPQNAQGRARPGQATFTAVSTLN